jgi:hypothetical protein
VGPYFGKAHGQWLYLARRLSNFYFYGSHVIPDGYPGPTFKKLGVLKIVMPTRAGIMFFF